MKEARRCKCYLRYCDDTTGLARTKGEAWNDLNEFCRLSEQAGLVVKASMVVAPIASVFGDGKNKKRRKRQRSHRKRTTD